MSTRRLAAILAADVVGFSALMEKDEEGTLVRIKSLRSDLIEPKVREHHGRIFKTTGDGVLVEFSSPVEAVRCAVSIQEALAAEARQGPAEALQLRIGINLGDIIVEDDGDVYGDGVNVAARLEQLAEPGAVCVSGKIYEEVRDKLPYGFEDKGEQQVKNIARPVRAYTLVRDRTPIERTGAKPLPLPDKPSIAVLPFTNISGDPEQEYFADGMVEDIITALSGVRWFFVIARNSSFTYKGRAVDVRQVGRELGVRYVLEGSVRKAGSRVRITGQLIEATTGRHLWAQRFDGELADIFDLQDRITESVVGAIEPSMRLAEVARSSAKPTESLTAYDLYLRALPHRYALTERGARTAIEYAEAAVSLDPKFATAKALAAYCYGMFVHQDWGEPDAANKAAALARSAVEDGWDDPEALRVAGHILGGIARDYDAAVAVLDRALALNSNSSGTLMSSAWVRLYVADYATAIDHFTRAMRLSPLDPEMYFAWGGLAACHLALENIHEALAWAEKGRQYYRGWATGFRLLITALVENGRVDEARRTAAEYIASFPSFRVSQWLRRAPIKDPEILLRWAHSYREAGLPE